MLRRAQELAHQREEELEIFYSQYDDFFNAAEDWGSPDGWGAPFTGAVYEYSLEDPATGAVSHHAAGMRTFTVRAGPFAEGKFRFAFYAKCDRGGRYCAKHTKRMMEGNVTDRTNLADAANLLLARRMAREFGATLAEAHAGATAEYVDCFSVERVVPAGIAPTPPAGGSNAPSDAVSLWFFESLVLQDPTHRFQKWNDNDPLEPHFQFLEDLVPHALSHFSYHLAQRSGWGALMLLDVQGVKQDGPPTRFLLTDPAIVSERMECFGESNTGQDGIDNFFLYHKCNKLCNQFRKPW